MKYFIYTSILLALSGCTLFSGDDTLTQSAKGGLTDSASVTQDPLTLSDEGTASVRAR